MYILNIEYMKSESGIYQWPTRSVTVYNRSDITTLNKKEKTQQSTFILVAELVIPNLMD